jgi:hypothetical protein
LILRGYQWQLKGNIEVTKVKRGKQTSKLLGTKLAAEGAHETASRARGTPRIALRLLRRISDFALVAGKSFKSFKLLKPHRGCKEETPPPAKDSFPNAWTALNSNQAHKAWCICYGNIYHRRTSHPVARFNP